MLGGRYATWLCKRIPWEVGWGTGVGMFWCFDVLASSQTIGSSLRTSKKFIKMWFQWIHFNGKTQLTTFYQMHLAKKVFDNPSFCQICEEFFESQNFLPLHHSLRCLGWFHNLKKFKKVTLKHVKWNSML
jgi:hypothetical protein